MTTLCNELIQPLTADGRVRGYVARFDTPTPLKGPHLGVAAARGLGGLRVERIAT